MNGIHADENLEWVKNWWRALQSIRIEYWIWKYNKNHKEWCKRAFERDINNMYDMENIYDIHNIHNNSFNHIYECNLIHDILNPSKHNKNNNYRYSPYPTCIYEYT